MSKDEPDAPAAEATADDGTIILPDRVEIRTVGELSNRIRGSKGPVALKAGKVTLVTSPGAQLLVAAVRDGFELTVIDPSNAFEDCLTMLGVDPVKLTPVRPRAKGAVA